MSCMCVKTRRALGAMRTAGPSFRGFPRNRQGLRTWKGREQNTRTAEFMTLSSRELLLHSSSQVCRQDFTATKNSGMKNARNIKTS